MTDKVRIPSLSFESSVTTSGIVGIPGIGIFFIVFASTAEDGIPGGDRSNFEQNETCPALEDFVEGWMRGSLHHF